MSAVKRKANDSDSAPIKKVRSIGSFFTASPSSSSSSPSSSATTTTSGNGLKFDKQKWISKLTAEQRGLLKLEIDTMDDSWLAVLKDDITTPEFLSLKKFLKAEKNAGKKVYPPEEDVYSWTRFTPLDAVKVVILGQDPYHGPNQAHGLSFSVRPPTRAPPSLKNMYIALKKDYPSFTPPPNNGGLLTPWATRGVLLLNACLTVRAAEPNSHSSKGWERLTQRAIDAVAQKRSGVVFLAWGTPAGKRVAKVDKKRHLVLSAVHPSPLSASRGFFDCGHFKKANEWLVGRYGEGAEINWSLHPETVEKKPIEKKRKKEEVEKDDKGAVDPNPKEKKEKEKEETKEKEAKEKEAPKAKKPKTRDSIGEVELDADEEEALVQATIEAEKVHASQEG